MFYILDMFLYITAYYTICSNLWLNEVTPFYLILSLNFKGNSSSITELQTIEKYSNDENK